MDIEYKERNVTSCVRINLLIKSVSNNGMDKMTEEKKYELLMLGTGNAMVTNCYNTCFAIRYNTNYFLVDAGGGNGILRQMEQANMDIRNLHDMFVTHGHTDHVLGAIWVIRKIASMMENNTYDGIFTIYCHDVVKKMLETFCEMMLTTKLLRYIGQRILITEVRDGEQIEIQKMDMKLFFFDILSTKAKQFGFRGELGNGKVITCLGDEPFNIACYAVVMGSDWLLSEAFCLYEDKGRFKPYEKHHSTALDAGRLASELMVKNLVLYHTEDKTLNTRKERYTKEAKENFHGNVYVPDDLETIVLD